jgi:hypothetical protein
MTTLQLTVAIDTACNLTVTDTTGYYNASTNIGGFLPETDVSALAAGIYKMSYGYFLNVVLYNKYNVAPIISNATESFFRPTVFTAVYADTFTPTIYTLTLDGSYTIKRIFLISLAFYNANKAGSLFTGKTIYYTDGINIFSVTAGVATQITVTVFLAADLTAFTGVIASSSFISTCFTNTCYFKIMSTLLAATKDEVDDKPNELLFRQRDLSALDNKKLIVTRDLLYMTLETIKYLKDFNNITQIQKLIESIDLCGALCGAVLKSGPTGCGCG